MLGKIALGGGGGAEDSAHLDAIFADWIGSQGHVLYWPIAMRGIIPFEACHTWFTTTFARYQINSTMWTELAGHQRSELDHFAGIYIGGGNTYALLAECLMTGFDRHLIDYVAAGGAIYGGSAGAVLLGTTIETVAHMDDNHVGLQETTCLNLADDHAIWVHYTEEDDERIAAFLAQSDKPVLALAEQAGVTIVNGELQSVGTIATLRFDQNGKHPL